MIYQRFNVDHPADFKGHSLSVSDIVALKQNGAVSCHYVDSIGFRELPNFLKPENYLKNAEMLLEDDYGMIDGIINNGPKQPTVTELEEQVKAGFSISLMELAAPAAVRGRKRRNPYWSSSKRKHRSRPQPKQRPNGARKESFDMKDKHFTHDEVSLMSIYNAAGTREGLIAALTEMRGYLDAEEAELRELTDSALAKLRGITDAEYAALDLTPDFDL